MTLLDEDGQHSAARPRIDEDLNGRDAALSELIDLGDLDELIREVDRRAERCDWQGLGRLILRSKAAHERGRQLWPAATYASHRLALEADPAWAVAAVLDGVSSLGLGPLTEVVSVRHDWADLAPWLPLCVERFVIGHERGLRRDPQVPDQPSASPIDPFGNSPVLSRVESGGEPATYTAWDLTAPRPPAVGEPVELHPTGQRVTPHRHATDGIAALRQLFEGWDGADCGYGVIGGHGSPAMALQSLEPTDRPEADRAASPGRTVERITAAEALDQLAWLAATGGPHGKRRGGAAGRFDALWTAVALAGYTDEWPLPNDELALCVDELSFYSVRRPRAPIGSTDGMYADANIPTDPLGVTDWSMGMIIYEELNELVWGFHTWVR